MRMTPTRRQLDALGACLDAPDGSIKEAAYAFGLSYCAMRSLLSRLNAQLGVKTLAQAVAACDERFPGWHVPVA